jgi:hypothetical protein
MTIIETKSSFQPNCVFIPESEGDDPERNACTLLILEGNNNYGECFTREAWGKGKPFYIRRMGRFDAVEGGRVELLPDLWVVKIDEREFWCESIIAQTTRIFGVYVFDRRRHVHCCSLTPSYELQFLGSQYESVENIDEEWLYEDIMEGDSSTSEVSYFDCHDIDRILKNVCKEGCLPKGNGGFQLEGIAAVTTDTAIEKAIESYRMAEF